MTEKERLVKELALVESLREKAVQTLINLREDARLLNQNIAGADSAVKILNQRLDKISKLMILEEPPNNQRLVKLHQKLVELVRESERKDITVSRLEDLRVEISRLEETVFVERKNNCDHRLVIGYNGYRGTRSDDYNDAYPSFRQCMVCGAEEHVYDYSRGVNFVVLGEKDGRIIELVDHEDFEPRLYYRPLPEIIQWFKNRYQ